MEISEPLATALLFGTFGLLMAVSVIFSRALERLGLPIVLLFLVLGMLAGSEGLGGVMFGATYDDYDFAFRLGTLALCLILFDGGLSTPWSAVREGIGPASVLATIGVVGTAGLVALTARMLGFQWLDACLLGAVVSSTDAAAVFSILRGSRLNLEKRVGVTLELESGINDPMAVILTMTLTEIAAGQAELTWTILLMVPLQLIVGATVGVAIGYFGRFALQRAKLRAGGLYAVLTLGLALISFGVATLVEGSGFLAVYVTAVFLGNSDIPYRGGLTRIHDAIAWLGQISMFLVLGLLVQPSQLLKVAWVGLAIALALAFIARPLVVWLCLLPFKFTQQERLYIGWVGLRGAVPIILATIPILAQIPHAMEIFDVVFFIVVINALIPGATLGWVTRRLGLNVEETPTPAAALEINSTQLVQSDILTFYIDETLAVTGVPLSRIKFPEGSSAILVVRGEELLAARGFTVLQPGDHVYVFCHRQDRPHIELLFGRGASS